jgi:hypothetical protein
MDAAARAGYQHVELRLRGDCLLDERRHGSPQVAKKIGRHERNATAMPPASGNHWLCLHCCATVQDDAGSRFGTPFSQHGSNPTRGSRDEGGMPTEVERDTWR